MRLGPRSSPYTVLPITTTEAVLYCNVHCVFPMPLRFSKLHGRPPHTNDLCPCTSSHVADVQDIYINFS